MALPNGRVVMGDSITPSTISPKSFSPTSGIPQSMTSSTLDDASLEELDRIMDTLSTLSREASMARGANDVNKYSLPSPPEAEQTPMRSYPNVSQGTTSFKSNHPALELPVPASVPIPPPTTSPPKTPMMQSQRLFTSHPKIMTLAAPPSQQPMSSYQPTRSDARNPATIPRLPVNPYENTSILHGSHMTVRPTNLSSSDNTNPFPLVPDSPYVNKNPSTSDGSGQCFFGQMPSVSPQESTSQQQNRQQADPRLQVAAPTANEIKISQFGNSRADFQNMHSQGNPSVISLHRPNQSNQEAHTLPAYNEKRSYLKNLEDGTLPRPRIDSTRQVNSRNVTPNLRRKNIRKPSLTEEAGEALNRLSFRRPSKNGGPRRGPGKFGLYNLSKTPSRHSTTSFNSFDMGRGYASVSTAPASTHGLIQHEVLPHGRKKRIPSPLANQNSSNSSEEEDENCCVKCGRFLYSHILELFILVAFFAGLPTGIVIQAMRFHTTEQYHKYYAFWGSTMLPLVLSSLTPLLVISSMMTGIGNLTSKVWKRLSLLAILYYLITTIVAISVAILFSLLISPGSQLASVYSNSTNLTKSYESTLQSDKIIIGVSNQGKDLAVYNATEAQELTAVDEILYLIRMFFPGCGGPALADYNGVCNLFAFALFAGVIGIGASSMSSEGGPIRHILSQIGVVMSNMADILLWYVPFGVFIMVSELVATRVDWTSIAHDQPPDKQVIFEGNETTGHIDVTALNEATKRFVLTVVSSIGIYCCLVMPLIVTLATLSTPFSAISFRTIAPLITSLSVGFSDLCIPLTLRCLLKRKGVSRCSKSQDRVDRRIARVTGVLGGIYHRAGTVILLTSSAIFLAHVENKQLSVGTILIIGVSSMISSVTSTTGRWFYGFSPYMRAIVISLSTARVKSPTEIPEKLLYFWAMCRLAAFTDTIVDIIGSHILHKYCKSMLRDVPDEKHISQDEECTDSSHIDSNKTRDGNSTTKMNQVQSTSGETSDYEDAPLLFSRSIETGNESSSMNSRNDDSVFLPNKPQEARPTQQSNEARNPDIMQQRPMTNNSNNIINGVSNQGEVSFVTF